jgi:HAD superfamily hydrolase (TIGR01549 family)
MSADFASIKAIFFDTSDTLYKNEELEKAYPARLVDMIAEAKSLDIDQAKQLLNDTTEKLKATGKHVTKIRAAKELGFSPEQVYELAFDKVVPSDFLTRDEALDAVIAGLAQRYSLGIISNLKRSHVTKVIDALGLTADSFKYLITLDIVQEIKPAAEPFLKAIELAGCDANECMYIGDSPTKDMHPAKEVGMKTVLIADNPTDEEMLHADAVISDVKDILDLLR